MLAPSPSSPAQTRRLRRRGSCATARSLVCSRSWRRTLSSRLYFSETERTGPSLPPTFSFLALSLPCSICPPQDFHKVTTAAVAKQPLGDGEVIFSGVHCICLSYDNISPPQEPKETTKSSDAATMAAPSRSGGMSIPVAPPASITNPDKPVPMATAPPHIANTTQLTKQVSISPLFP